MPKPKKKAPWLIEHEDKVKELEAEIKQFLKDVDTCIESNNTTNDELKSIDYYKNQALTEKIMPYKEDIIKNLKNKKINVFKNFIIKFFTLGKINKNKDIDNKIASFKSYCYIKIANLKEELENKHKNMIIKKYHNVLEQRNQEKKQNSKLEQYINNLGQKISNLEQNNIAYEETIKTLNSEIEDNKKIIADLKLENETYKAVQDKHNQNSIDKFTTLNNMLKGEQAKVEFYKNEVERLAKELELRDSGVESALEVVCESNTDNFNKNEINKQQEQVTNKKSNKVRLATIQ